MPLAVFADVIIPLSAGDAFTYSLSAEDAPHIAVGQRVVVPFGKQHFYTGIVARVHHDAPSYAVKAVACIMDIQPLVLPAQIDFWRWVADYYFSNLGTVLQMALPSVLLLKSESRLVLSEDYDKNQAFSDKEILLLEALERTGRLDFAQMAEILQIKTVQPYVNALLQKKCIFLEEEIQEKYKAKTAVFLCLAEQYHTDVALQALYAQVEKFPKQVAVLMAYQLLKNQYADVWVKKTDLEKQAVVSSAVLKGLIDKNIFIASEKPISRLKNTAQDGAGFAHLSLAQNKAFEEMQEAFENNKTVLLQGVSGSGKTEIYMHAIAKTLAEGKRVLYLLPEIGLTFALLERLQKAFGKAVGVYHARFNFQERAEIWQACLSQAESHQVIVGTRMALFLPFQNLGLVIVDEEHDASYKQLKAPFVQGRDLANVLAKKHGANLILGSATPSLESYYLAKTGHYQLVLLTERYGLSQFPKIALVDLKENKKEQTPALLSPKLHAAVEEALQRKEQVIIFQNRRGYAPYISCNLCDFVPICPNCDISLTYYKTQHALRCNYCGHQEAKYSVCPNCKSLQIKEIGLGTEKVQESIAELFADAVVKRMDLDSTQGKTAYMSLVEAFEAKEIDILVGTQMLSKGLDFQGVSVVGVLHADNMLHYPNFRTAERAFQLFMQVSGRAGRGAKQGTVYIQTYATNHFVLQAVKNQDIEVFYAQELQERQSFCYPPYTRIIQIILQHKQKEIAHAIAVDLALLLKQDLSSWVIGPASPSLEKIRTLYQKEIWIKVPRAENFAQARRIISQHVHHIKNKHARERALVFLNTDA